VGRVGVEDTPARSSVVDRGIQLSPLRSYLSFLEG